MPLNKTQNKYQVKEKTDHKQMLLDLIAKQYGPSNAIVMEKAFKNQDKQLDEAMLSQGMGAEDVAKSKGIDLDMLNGLVNSDKPKEQSQQLIANKPASSPLGFGGMSMENGQITEQKPGLLAGLISTLFSGSPNTAAKMDLAQLAKAAGIQKQQQMSQDKTFYQYNPITGALEEVATIPKGAEVRNVQVSPQERAEAYGKVSKEVAKYKEEIKRETPERVTMVASLDQMDTLLTDMENYIAKDPMVFVKGINPLAEREFKAIVDNFDKTAAIAAGGKQLTKTELDLIKKTRPSLLDTKHPEAIKYKFNILRNTLALAKDRLNRSTQTENKSEGQEGTQTFNIGGKVYNIPTDKVESFKKAKGIR